MQSMKYKGVLPAKEMEKIDIHNTVRNLERARARLERDESICAESRQLILAFMKDRAIGRTERAQAHRNDSQTRGIRNFQRSKPGKAGERTQLKYLYRLKIPAQYFGKSIGSLALKDLEEFIGDLESDAIKSCNGKRFSGETKTGIKKVLILFLRWLLGEHSRKYHELTYWIDTSYQPKEVRSLSETEVKRLMDLCSDTKQKVLIACLFDGGFRIEEFLNIRNSDVELVNGNVPFYRLTVREEFSKTNGRTVAMYWPQTYNAISQWLSSRDASNDPDAPFFPGTYNGVRMSLTRLGQRLGRRVHPHLFRHSSATYFAIKGWNEFKMNYRYGWSKNSDMGRHYIERAKISEAEEGDAKLYEAEVLGDIKSKLESEAQEKQKLVEENASMQTKYAQLEDELSEIRKLINSYLPRSSEIAERAP